MDPERGNSDLSSKETTTEQSDLDLSCSLSSFVEEDIHTWESQSFIGTVPAGNILLSSALLYSGSLPSKALRMFQVLKCAAIDRTTFLCHQSKYLQPAIATTWKRDQESLLDTFKDEKKALVVAGDGRTDSPGHSATYGCYTFLELSCNKVVHFKLVQVYNF